MKCILVLTFVAFCYSYPYGASYKGGRNVNISEDGTIVITGEDGKRVTITKVVGVTGKKIDIAVSGPNIPTKRVQIDEQKELKDVNLWDENNDEITEDYQRDKRSSKDNKKRYSQGDTLAAILNEYQGVVDEQLYEQLLKKVSYAVQTGQLSASIYEILQSLNQRPVGQSQGLWNHQQGISRQQIQNQGSVGSSLQWPNNILDLLRRQVIQQQLQELQQQQQQQNQYQRYQQGGYYGAAVPYSLGQQQVLSTYGQTLLNPYETNEGRVTVTSVQGVPRVGGRQNQIVEGIYLQPPQVVTYPSVEEYIYTIGGGQRTPLTGSSLSDVLNIYGTQGSQQHGVPWRQFGQQGRQYGRMGEYAQQIEQSVPVQVAEVIQEEREILGQQRQIQQQQLQQQQQQQVLQARLQQQWQQQQQQQLLQQVQQQQEEQQLQQQIQQQKYNTWQEYLLNGGPIQNDVQQSGLLQQQLGVYSQGGLNRGYRQQEGGVPAIQRYNVPLVI